MLDVKNLDLNKMTFKQAEFLGICLGYLIAHEVKKDKPKAKSRKIKGGSK